MAKTINFEARKYIPLPLDEVVIDWSIINIAADTGLQLQGADSRQGGAKPPTVEVFLWPYLSRRPSDIKYNEDRWS